tara:strand:+ start:89287 stop:90660 length:1374 start_codon:yes stop_codon:yes gene_type:complete
MSAELHRIHFISIGGAVMHNLAIELKERGLAVSGSDDEIYNPSRANLEKHGLLPATFGWDASRVTKELDAVVVGMHAKKDNPELTRAQELGIKIFSYPDFILEQSRAKQRIVVAGSHGKTTVTAMIMHVLQHAKKPFDYVVGAHVPGFERTIRLSNAPIIIIEGDEYLASPLDPMPKFLRYDHHIGIITGLAWDHMNVFPTFDDYVKQFDKFADATPKAGTLIYNEMDDLAVVIAGKERADVKRVAYGTHPHSVVNGKTVVNYGGKELELKIFGDHNMSNMQAALSLVKLLSIPKDTFYEAMVTFTGAEKRLNKVAESNSTTVFYDFAHAPSKVDATVKAVKKIYPNRKLVAVVELHTFSSLNKGFIPTYKNTLNAADKAVVFINPHVLEARGISEIDETFLRKSFNRNDLTFVTNINKLKTLLEESKGANTNFLFMSSGNFEGTDVKAFANELTQP